MDSNAAKMKDMIPMSDDCVTAVNEIEKMLPMLESRVIDLNRKFLIDFEESDGLQDVDKIDAVCDDIMEKVRQVNTYAKELLEYEKKRRDEMNDCVKDCTRYIFGRINRLLEAGATIEEIDSFIPQLRYNGEDWFLDEGGENPKDLEKHYSEACREFQSIIKYFAGNEE